MMETEAKSTDSASEDPSEAMTLKEILGPGPLHSGVEKTPSENRNQHQRKGKQTTHIQPPPSARHLHCPRVPSLEGEKTTRPTPPILSLASSQQKEGGGQSACHQHTPLTAGASRTLKRCQNPFPRSGVPSHPFMVFPTVTRLEEKPGAG